MMKVQVRDQVEEQFLQPDAGTGVDVGPLPAGDAVRQWLDCARRSVVVEPEMQLHLGAVVAEEPKLLEGVAVADGLDRRQALGYGRLQNKTRLAQSCRRLIHILLMRQKVPIARSAHHIVGIEDLKRRTFDQYVSHRCRVEGGGERASALSSLACILRASARLSSRRARCGAGTAPRQPPRCR